MVPSSASKRRRTRLPPRAPRCGARLLPPHSTLTDCDRLRRVDPDVADVLVVAVLEPTSIVSPSTTSVTRAEAAPRRTRPPPRPRRPDRRPAKTITAIGPAPATGLRRRRAPVGRTRGESATRPGQPRQGFRRPQAAFHGGRQRVGRQRRCSGAEAGRPGGTAISTGMAHESAICRSKRHGRRYRPPHHLDQRRRTTEPVRAYRRRTNARGADGIGETLESMISLICSMMSSGLVPLALPDVAAVDHARTPGLRCSGSAEKSWSWSTFDPPESTTSERPADSTTWRMASPW